MCASAPTRSHLADALVPPPPASQPMPAAALMSSIYEDHKDEDGFLYITYSGENTFGGSGAEGLELAVEEAQEQERL